MKKIGSILLTMVVTVMLLSGCGTQPSESSSNGGEEQTGPGKPKYISIATSSAGGAFSIIGTAMSDVINKNVEGLSANIEITGGSSENVLLAENKQVELAMTATDALYLAKNGEGSFEGKQVQDVVGVMGGHLVTVQVYVLRDGDIKSFQDLKGKKVSIGPPGSVANDAMNIIMSAYGYKINEDWTPEYLSHGDGSQALTDGNIDAVVIMSTLPASPISTAAASKPISILEIDPDVLDTILTENPFYMKAEIPAGLYDIPETIENTFGSASLMIANKDVPEDDIYNIVKALYEHNDVLAKAYPQCDEWIPENATRGFNGIVDMHPGTIRYLKEEGLIK